MWVLTPGGEIGHIRLARDPDMVVVAPATANLLAKMAHGIADDLASTLLLATDRPVLVAPAMNVVIWEKEVTQANLAALGGAARSTARCARGCRKCESPGSQRRPVGVGNGPPAAAGAPRCHRLHAGTCRPAPIFSPEFVASGRSCRGWWAHRGSNSRVLLDGTSQAPRPE